MVASLQCDGFNNGHYIVMDHSAHQNNNYIGTMVSVNNRICARS